jgi:hypothetical protein
MVARGPTTHAGRPIVLSPCRRLPSSADIVTNYIAGGISLFRNSGSGVRHVDYEGNRAPFRRLGRREPDFRPDIVVANYRATPSRSTVQGFSASDNFVAGPNPIGVLVGDLNGDSTMSSSKLFGRDDLSAAGRPAGYSVAAALRGAHEAAGRLGTDLNSDGRMDVVVPESSGSVMVLRAIGLRLRVRTLSHRVAAGVRGGQDFDWDGYRIWPWPTATRTASRSQRHGAGRLSSAGPRRRAARSVPAATDDLNGDGRLALTVWPAVRMTCPAARQRDGQLGTASTRIRPLARALVTADLNGDGLLACSPHRPARALEIPAGHQGRVTAAPRLVSAFLRPVALAVEPATTGESPRVFVADAGANRGVVFDADWASGGAAAAVEIALGDGGELTALELVDLDGDARLDLAAILAASGRVALCPGDAGAAAVRAALYGGGPGAAGSPAATSTGRRGRPAVTARGSDQLRLDGTPGAAVPRPWNIFTGLNWPRRSWTTSIRTAGPTSPQPTPRPARCACFSTTAGGGLTGSASIRLVRAPRRSSSGYQRTVAGT